MVRRKSPICPKHPSEEAAIDIMQFSLKILTGFSAALMLLACSKDSSPSGPGLALTDKGYLAQGWQQFEAQRYDSAVVSFTSAFEATSSQSVKTEALEGRGWCSMQKRELTKAKSDFLNAITTPGITAGALNDARVGISFTLYALNMFSEAALYASAALTDNPSYAFAHDSRATVQRVRLLLAQSYYANGQFALAAAQMDILVPSHAPHPSDPAPLLGSITAALNSL
jgi:hypothetical protein